MVWTTTYQSNIFAKAGWTERQVLRPYLHDSGVVEVFFYG
jgi:hypothetical protein